MKIKFAKDIIKEIEKRGSICVPDGCVTGELFERWLKERRMNMKLILEDMFTKQHQPAFNNWKRNINKIIKEYVICTDTIENEYGKIELWCYDDDLARLFYDSGIGVGKSFNVEKVFNYDDNYNPVGLNYGDYIETVELKQNGKSYLVPVYCAYNGVGADYAFALFEATKKEYSNVKER